MLSTETNGSKDFFILSSRCPLNTSGTVSFHPSIGTDTAIFYLVTVATSILSVIFLSLFGSTESIGLWLKYSAISSTLKRYFISPLRYRIVIIMLQRWVSITDRIAPLVTNLAQVRVRIDKISTLWKFMCPECSFFVALLKIRIE